MGGLNMSFDKSFEENFINYEEFSKSFTDIMDPFYNCLGMIKDKDKTTEDIQQELNNKKMRKLLLNLWVQACKLQCIGGPRVYHEDDSLEILIKWKEPYKKLPEEARPGAMFKDLLLVIDRLQGDLPGVAKEFRKG